MSKPLEVDDSSFTSSVIESKLPVLVDFWASWCAPCRAVGPIIEELATEYSNKISFAKVNVDQCPGTSNTYGIRSIPTMLLFKDGKPMKQIVGLRPKAELKELLDTALS